jgi:ADP-ribose pyrophosphatase YjhB (NUDIX family)
VNEAAICVLQDVSGRVLAVSRKGDPHDMALPGGHVEEGETAERAAIREVFEETGLTVANLEKIFEHREPGDAGKLVHVYRARSSNAHSTTITSEPGEYARFVTPAELKGAKSFGGFASRYTTQLFPAQAPGIRSSIAPAHVTADLSPSSVHVDSTSGGMRRETAREKNPAIPDLSGLGSPAFAQPTPPKREDVQPFPRWPLKDSKFALPAKNAYPIDTAARVRNAAARLEQNKSRLSSARSTRKHARASRARRRSSASTPNTTRRTPLPRRRRRRPCSCRTCTFRPSSRTAVISTFVTSPKIARKSSRSTTKVASTSPSPRSSTTSARAMAPCGIRSRASEPSRATLRDRSSSTITSSREIIANWERGGRKPIPVDFEHASEADATSGSIPQKGAPAQAWIVDLRNFPPTGGLDGLFDDWDPTARMYVKTKKYRFFSPAIRFGSRDKVSGRPIGCSSHLWRAHEPAVPRQPPRAQGAHADGRSHRRARHGWRARRHAEHRRGRSRRFTLGRLEDG